MLVEGLKLMLWGYFKKLVVADRLAIYVNAIYDNSEKHNGTTLLVATIFYAFQIYADFSGYTDIARGSAKLFGFDLMDNFKRPYFATSIKEFWNRWHITFSTWLRDYIFLPLAYYLSGRMKKTSYLFISTENWIYLIISIITFGICGIWHGVATLTEATKIIGKIFTSAGAVFYHSPYDLIYSIIGILFLIILDFKREYFNNRLSILYSRYQGVRIAGIITIIIIILLIGVFDGGQFIYFQY